MSQTGDDSIFTRCSGWSNEALHAATWFDLLSIFFLAHVIDNVVSKSIVMNEAS